MPNILHCIDTTGPGGAETVFIGLAERFSRAPFHSVAMIRGPGWVKDQLDARGIPLIKEDSRGSVNLRFLRALVREVRARCIDLVHAHLLGANVYCAMAGAITGVPVVSTFHGSMDISSRERMARLKLWIVRKASTTVAVSEGLRDEVAGRMGVPVNRVRLIQNGIDCGRFTGAEPLGLRRRLGLGPESLLLGSLGNIRPAKAYDVGLKVLATLRAAGVDAHWVVAGQGRPGDRLLGELQALAGTLGVTPQVHFLGFVDAPERFLADLDVFLLCSTSEGHPLALVQAMAAGVPVVATRCGVEGMLGDGTRGVLADVGDVAGLAAAVGEIRPKLPEAQARSHAARELVRASFDNEAIFGQYESLSRDLLGTAR
ncbi:MAG TPA: glycosyltransferase [Burkholderiales bacterium]|nr:glycosyltransferase [Burkholderiales bacterium]